MALLILNGPVIEAGESLSDAIDCTSGEIVRLTMPAQWTAGANITFQISSDGNAYNDLYTTKGEEVTIRGIKPSSAVVVTVAALAQAAPYFKIRSGTREHPVEQKERREFAVAVQTTVMRSKK